MTTTARLGLFGRHAAYVIAFVVIWIFPLLNALLPRHMANSFFRVVDATFITGQVRAARRGQGSALMHLRVPLHTEP